MALTLKEERLIGPKVASAKNIFHLRGAGFLGVNDLIFRKRLLNSSWKFRKKVLGELKSFFSVGQTFDISNLDADTASLKRDFALLFGGKKAILAQLELEAKCLPLNQKPSYHERYAQIAELSKLQFDTPMSKSLLIIAPADKKARLLGQAYEFLDRNTPQVSKDWTYWTIQNGTGVGMGFASQNAASAQKFLEEVEAAREAEAKGEEVSSLAVGLRAFKFLPIDPLLLDPKTIEIEAELVSFILDRVDEHNSVASAPERWGVVTSEDISLPTIKQQAD